MIPLPTTPGAFRIWLDGFDDWMLFDVIGNPIELYLLTLGNAAPAVGYSDYSIDGDIAEPMPDWATDVIHTISSGFYPTVGDLKRHLDGERPRFLEGIPDIGR